MTHLGGFKTLLTTIDSATMHDSNVCNTPNNLNQGKMTKIPEKVVNPGLFSQVPRKVIL